MSKLALFALLLLCNASTLYAGNSVAATPTSPANDDIQRFYWLNDIGATFGHISGSNVGATRQIGNGHGFITGQPEEPYIGGQYSPRTSVWYVWSAPYSATVWMSTLGSDFDTVMGVYLIGDGDSLVSIVSNDDINSGLHTSSVIFDAIWGQNYYITVAGKDGETGNIELGWLLAEEITPAAAEMALKLTAISPYQVNQGAGDHVITATGTGFTADSQVYIDGFPINLGSTTFMGDNRLEAHIPASYFGASRSLELTVHTGTSVSNSAKFYVAEIVAFMPAPTGSNYALQAAAQGAFCTLDDKPSDTLPPPSLTAYNPSGPLANGVGSPLGSVFVINSAGVPATALIATPLFSDQGTGLISSTLVAAPVVSNDGNSLITNDGGTLITNDGGTLIGNNGNGGTLKLSSTNISSTNTGWFIVKSSGGTTPATTTSDGWGFVAATFDETSTPKASELAKMVLALVVDPKLSPCDATLSSSALLLTIPIITVDVYKYWANFKNVPNTLNWTLNNYGLVGDASRYSHCAPSTLSADLKLHIPAATFSGGSYNADFQGGSDLTFTYVRAGVN